jgi:TonB family protein
MQLFRRSLTVLVGTLALTAASLQLRAQTASEFEIFAARTAEDITKTHPRQVLAAGLDGCLLDEQVCFSYDATLHAALEKLLPTVTFVDQGEVGNLLKSGGFLKIDVYNSSVLRAIAPKTGAEVLVTENLAWAADGYEFTSEIFDVYKDNSLSKFKGKVARNVANAGDEPTLIKDPDTGISLVVWKQKKSGFPVFRFVSCERCPDPQYTEEARKKQISGTVAFVATVTEQGTLQSINVVKSLDPGLDHAAIDIMRTWRLKPAIGLDGNAMSVRVPIEVSFKLLD